jgi:hypothetical protein
MIRPSTPESERNDFDLSLANLMSAQKMLTHAMEHIFDAPEKVSVPPQVEELMREKSIPYSAAKKLYEENNNECLKQEWRDKCELSAREETEILDDNKNDFAPESEAKND